MQTEYHHICNTIIFIYACSMAPVNLLVSLLGQTEISQQLFDGWILTQPFM